MWSWSPVGRDYPATELEVNVFQPFINLPFGLFRGQAIFMLKSADELVALAVNPVEFVIR